MLCGAGHYGKLSVIGGAQLGAAQHIVSLPNLFESFFRLRVVAIHIRVPLMGQPQKSIANLVRGRMPSET